MEAKWRLRVIIDLISYWIFGKPNWGCGMNRMLGLKCQSVHWDMMFLTSDSLHNLKGQKWSYPCYHPRHLQQIHCNELLCQMYGFTAKLFFPLLSTMSPINRIIRKDTESLKLGLIWIASMCYGASSAHHLASIVEAKSTRKKTYSGRTNSKESRHQCSPWIYTLGCIVYYCQVGICFAVVYAI